MGKRIFRFLQYFIFLGGGLFLVWWQLKSMTKLEMDEFTNALQQTEFSLIIPVALMSLLSHISRSMRWKLLMEPLGYHPSLINTFGVTMIGYLANSAVPRLGEILKCTLLSKYEKLKVDKLVGTIIVERSFDLVCFLFFVLATVLVQFNRVESFFEEQMHTAPGHGMAFWIKILVAISILGAAIIFGKKKLKKFNHLTPVNKINEFFNGVFAGFKSIGQLKKRKLFLAHTVFIWAMYLGQIYLGFKSMSGTHHLGVQAAMAVLSLATVSMIVTPGGIGSFPIFVMEVLTLYQIHSPLGKAFGWLMWGVSTAFIIVFGLICLVFLPYYNNKKNEVDSKY